MTMSVAEQGTEDGCWCTWCFHLLEHVIVALFFTAVVRALVTGGVKKAMKFIITFLRDTIPGLNAFLRFAIRVGSKEAMAKLVPDIDEDGDKSGAEASSDIERVTLPAVGIDHKALLEEMESLKAKDIDTDKGRLFAFVYTTEKDPHMAAVLKAKEMYEDKYGLTDNQLKAFVDEAYHIFSHENALNPAAFPSLRKFERDCASMIASMLNGDLNVVGNMTSGGTESILMAVKTYRDMARATNPRITTPELVAPTTIHPAFNKACSYFNVKLVLVPVNGDYRADVRAMEQAITKNTILIAVSAPQYPHGIVDPVEEMGAIAEAHGIPMHVDACFGGFMLPWCEKMGRDIPVFDFRVKAVTSMSADIHKYGWGAKGASMVLFRNKSIRKYMIFSYAEWPGGLFASPGMAGSRPGGIIAASWAALRTIGESGFMKIAQGVMATTDKIRAAVDAIEEIEVVGNPHMCALAVKAATSSFNVLALADVLEEAGWRVERQQYPACLHLSIMPHHNDVVDDFCAAIQKAVEDVKAKKIPDSGVAPMYGAVAKMPDASLVNDFLTSIMNNLY